MAGVEADVSSVNERVDTHSKDIATLNGKMAGAVTYDAAAHTSVTLGGAGARPKLSSSKMWPTVASPRAAPMR